jgi:protochlorophyllide reductase
VSQPWTADQIPDQSGRVALVTGASSGLGLETARALAARGAIVVLACRSLARAEQARQELLPTAEGPLDILELDLSDLQAVEKAAAVFAERWGRLDLLINNAGVMAPPRTLSRDGYELQLAVNHLGHFALTRALMSLLWHAPGARVVTVSSGAHYFGTIAFDDLQAERRYDRWRAYAQSKLANVMFTLELQRRLQQEVDLRPGGPGESPPMALAAHPGFARTNLQPASIALNGSRLEAWAYRLMDPLFQTAAMGALPQLHAATAPAVQPGGFYGPDQLGGLRGYPRPAKLAPAALDEASCRRLWDVSEALCAARVSSPPAVPA